MRGNRFSRSHVSLNPDVDEEQYWTHDWDTVGMNDIPAMLDHITATTGAEKVFYSSHSMGGTAFLVSMAERPEMQQKVAAAYLMAPPAWIEHAPDIMVAASQFVDLMERMMENLGQTDGAAPVINRQ